MQIEIDESNWKEEKKQFGTKIGQIIKEERLKRGLTQRQVTEKAGFYRTFIGLIENGKYSPSVFTVWRIAKAMDVELSELLRKLN
jgi:transcriptional regulator with XRE-family HTH domain